MTPARWSKSYWYCKTLPYNLHKMGTRNGGCTVLVTPRDATVQCAKSTPVTAPVWKMLDLAPVVSESFGTDTQRTDRVQ